MSEAIAVGIREIRARLPGSLEVREVPADDESFLPFVFAEAVHGEVGLANQRLWETVRPDLSRERLEIRGASDRVAAGFLEPAWGGECVDRFVCRIAGEPRTLLVDLLERAFTVMSIQRGARRLQATLAETRTAAIAGLQAKGYAEIISSRAWTLALERFRPELHGSATTIAATAGVRLVPYGAAAREIPDLTDQVQSVHERMLGEMPLPVRTQHYPPDLYRSLFLDPDRLDPEATVLALDGTRAIGLALTHVVSTGVAYLAVNGVLGRARGKRVSLALKLAVIEALRERGYRTLTLRLDQDNTPSRRILRWLGFERLPNQLHFQKRLSRSTE